jgi:nitrate/nitrite transport system substrate-binding protein
MPFANDPFDADKVLHRSGCSCGLHKSEAEHAAETALSEDDLLRRAVEGAVVRAVFPVDAQRRAFIKAVGASTAFAAIAQFLPLATATEVFAAKGQIETPNLKIGFIPITCATPLVMAAPMGIYAKHGLKVEVVKTAGWAVIRDKSLSKEYDAAHMLSPMPLAISLGLGSTAAPFAVTAIENVNGQAITLAMKHQDKRDPKQWKGFKFGRSTIITTSCCYYWPSRIDGQGRDCRVPPPNGRQDEGGRSWMASVAGPMNQRAVYDGVGFIHLLSKEIWNRHPCCAFAASEEFVKQRPHTARAVLKAIIEATAYATQPANRKQVAEFIAPENYLNQPVEVVEQVLTGKFPDGLGNQRNVPDRIDFDPFPWQSFAVWILTQMKRWGQIKGDVDYAGIAQKVYLATDTVQLMRESGLTPPQNAFKKFSVMGKEFDPSMPDQYLAGFAIKR